MNKFQTNNQIPQEIFALPMKSIALASTSVFILGLTLSTYWFSNKVNALNGDLYEARETIATYKSELNRVALRADESNALFNHLKSVVADTNEQLTGFKTQFAYQVNELKDAVNTDAREELAQKDAINNIGEKVDSVGDEQKAIGINFKDIEGAIQKLAEKVLDIKMTVNEIAASTANKQDVAANQPKNGKELTAKEYFVRGNKKYDDGDYKGAIEDFSSAVRLNSYYATVLKNVSKIKYQTGDDTATADINKTKEAAPDLKSKVYAFIEKAKSRLSELVR